MDFRVILILIAEALFAFLLLLHAGVLKSRRAVFVSVLLIAAAFTVRGLCLDYVTLDYKDFLSKWVDFYRQNGGFKALHYPLGNYNIPYLYFLCLFSYSSINDLYLIKLLSIFFDVLLAYGAMMLLGKVRESIPARIACFFTVLFLPTVILNGSLWAQCDSIYVALAVLAIYFAPFSRNSCSALKPQRTPIPAVFAFTAAAISIPESPISTEDSGVTASSFITSRVKAGSGFVL